MGKREFETDSTQDRDDGQRSLGYVGLSAIAHVALLVAVLLAPSFKEQIKNIAGIDTGSTVEVGAESNDPAGEAADTAAAPADNQAATSGEVMLADANDPTGVNVPAEKPSVPETKEAAAEPAPQVVAKPVAEIPKQAPKIAKQVAKPVAKIAKPKVTSAPIVDSPEEKAAPVEAKETLEGDVAINAPKKEEEQTEVQPQKPIEVAAAVPEEPVAEAAAPVADDAKEEAKEEEKPAAAAAVVETPKTEEKAPEPKAEAKAETPNGEAPKAEEAKPIAKEEPSKSRSLFSVLPKMNQGDSNALRGSSNSGTSSGTTSSANNAPAAPAAAPAQTQAAQNGNGTATTGAGAAAAGAGAGAAMGAAAAGGAPVRDARSLVAMPGNPKPVYPLADKMAGRQGTAVLLGRVRPDGTVGEVAVERTSGSRLMDQSAAAAFKNWKYKPGQEGLVRLPVQFQLVGDAKEMPTHLRRQ